MPNFRYIPEGIIYPEAVKVDLMFYWKMYAEHPSVFRAVFEQ